MKNKSNCQIFANGLLIGAVNGIFGAGGGIVAVPLLQKAGLEKKQAHTNAVAVILPISIFSAAMYLIKKDVTFAAAMPYIPAGVVGALLGTYILKKISVLWLKRIFGIFTIYAGVRLLFK